MNMIRREPVFFSFHFDKDVMRTQLVRNIGAIEGNEAASANDWESIKRNGTRAVENWIEQNMKNKRCVIVLVGEKTFERPWVLYEIEKAWKDGRGLFGIRIHNLKDMRDVKLGLSGTSSAGSNPFDRIVDSQGRRLSNFVTCYDPGFVDTYGEISKNLQGWISQAIQQKEYRVK